MPADSAIASNANAHSAPKSSLWFSDTAWLVYLALLTVIVHILVGRRYGFHRDELATLDDARHLAWGYVAYPPVTPFFGRLSLILFGPTLPGFRLFAALAQAGAVLLTGLMAKEMGGARAAQFVAALAALPFCLGAGALMQYVSFDHFFWVLAAYFMIRLLTTQDPRWWLGIGAALGFGMLTKYTMGVFVAGVVAAVLFTDARRYLRSKWLWCGAALSLLIFLPNLLWQVQNHFISLDFLKHIHERDVQLGRAKYFLPQQLELALLAFPLWMAGLYFSVRPEGKRFRAIAWMYLVPLLLLLLLKGRHYYLAPAYPMLFAAGSVWGESWLNLLKRPRARAIQSFVFFLLTADVAVAALFALPILPINSPLWKFVTKVQPELKEEIGWPDFVQTVARIRDSLPPEQKTNLGILAANYGEAGAINLLGPAYHLPPAISGVNSFWARGYGDPPPDNLIVLGHSAEYLNENFSHCYVVGHPWNQFAVINEETLEHPDIFFCRGPKKPWPEFWKSYRHFG